ncbi:MAG: PAS domain-containing protein [Candidatus Cloacimonetes bacterium]|nr:PAS domain-containing protein [Candidatus Cloacimonadota bacterium]
MKKYLWIVILSILNFAFLSGDSLSSENLLSINFDLLHILLTVFLGVIILIAVYRIRTLGKLLKLKTAELEMKDENCRKLEAEFKQSEAMFSLTFKHAPIGIAMRAMDGRLIDINQAYADILGYSRQELLAGVFEQVGYLEDIPKSEAEYDKLIAGAKSVHIEKRLIKNDASIIYVSQRLVLIRDSNDNPLYLMSMTSDITQQKKSMQELIENEEFYRSVLSNMSGIVYNCANDKNWTMYYISEGILQITGYPAADFISSVVRSYTSIIHPDDREMVNQAIQEGITNKTSYILEYRLIHKDGSIVWVFEEGRGIYSDKGEFLHLNGTIININDHKTAELELQHYREHLEEMVADRTRDLEEKTRKLEEFNRLFVGREHRIKELRDEIKELKKSLRV